MLQLSRENSWCLAVIFFIILFSLNLASGVRINEIMPNPEDSCSDCSEWIELYGQNENLTDYEINTTNEKINFSVYIEDYIIITKNKTVFVQIWNINEKKVIEWKGMSLVNSGEDIFLFDDNLSLMSNVNYPSISTNKTYSLLENSSWVICDKPSPASLNSCQGNGANQSQGNTTQPAVYLELEYAEKVENGDFEVEVKAYNLNGSYDVKVYIIDGEDIVSDTYNEEEEKWKSSTYFVDEFINGTGNKSEMLKLMINDENFSGNVEIMAKIRETGETIIIDEYSGDMEVLEKEEVNEEENESENVNELTNEIKTENSSVIKLNKGKDIKSPNVDEYKSKTEYIKEYAIYIFAAFCVFVIIWMVIKKI